MTNIHKKEKELFNKWLSKSMKLGDGKNLAPDGLLYRGKLVPCRYPKDDKCYWEREEGNEEDIWYNSSKRLLIITKDLNNVDEKGQISEAWDIRVETGLKNDKDSVDFESCVCFYKRLRMWAYGLLHMDVEGNYPAYENARNMKISGCFYLHAPIARINCKKQCGYSSISDSKLQSYLDKYRELLIENLTIYNRADIILCCAGTGIIKNFIKDNYLKDLIEVPNTNEWIYYSPSTNKTVINSWHPSDRKSYKVVYHNMMNAYSYFLKNKNH